MTPLSLVASAFLFAGLWSIGSRRRAGFLATVVGELLWAGIAADRGMWDLAAVCAVFAVTAIRNFCKWG